MESNDTTTFDPGWPQGLSDFEALYLVKEKSWPYVAIKH